MGGRESEGRGVGRMGKEGEERGREEGEGEGGGLRKGEEKKTWVIPKRRD